MTTPRRELVLGQARLRLNWTQPAVRSPGWLWGVSFSRSGINLQAAVVTLHRHRCLLIGSCRLPAGVCKANFVSNMSWMPKLGGSIRRVTPFMLPREGQHCHRPRSHHRRGMVNCSLGPTSRGYRRNGDQQVVLCMIVGMKKTSGLSMQPTVKKVSRVKIG